MKLTSVLVMTFVLPLISSCDYVSKLELRAKNINKYEVAALNLAKENRQLKAQINKLNYKVSELEAKNKFLHLQIRKQTEGRKPASIRPVAVDSKNDMVKFSTYKWKDTELLKIARTELKKKNYSKAAQFFYTLYRQYPMSELINDTVLFQAGMSSFESKKYYSWSSEVLSKLVKEYPNSKYYRGAKLWRALSSFKTGDTTAFYNTVEEFRLKYRNTPEWKILSKHYEELTNKYKD